MRETGFLIAVITCCAFTVILPEIPKIYVIGDSISIQYGPYLKSSGNGQFEYDRLRDNGQAMADLDNPVGANGGDSGRVLDILENWDRTNGVPDYFVVNCGLHDIKTNRENIKQVDSATYAGNLVRIVERTKALGSRMIWVETTPVVDSIHNKSIGFKRFNADVDTYNAIANRIMAENNIPVIPLNQFTAQYIPEGYKDHVHYTQHVRQLQGAFLAGWLAAYFETVN